MLLTFVLDVHPSMGSHLGKPNTCGGLTQSSAGCVSSWSQLDSAKSIVEQFLHFRETHLRMLTSNREQQDYYMLVTTEHRGSGIKCGLGVMQGVFGPTLKTIVHQNDASECTSIGTSVGAALRLMNKHRLEIGVDHFGRGRLPWLTEFGAIIILTNGYRGSTADCSFPPDAPSMILGELCSQPFRWDQRIYAVITELGINPSQPLCSLCNSTGGMVVCSEPGPQATQAVEAQAAEGDSKNSSQNIDMEVSSVRWKTAKNDTAVVEPLKISQEPIHAILTPQGNTGHWPIPEPFWVDYTIDALLPRPTAQPEIFYSRSKADIFALNTIIELVDRLDMPADWYELDWCKPPARGGALHMDSRNTRWPVFIADSDRKGGLGEPFGYLRASPVAGHVILVVLSFNFPQLILLLQQAHEKCQAFPSESGLGTIGGKLGGQGGLSYPSIVQLNCLSKDWKQDMSKYLSDIPSYYMPCLYQALQKFGLHGFAQNFEKGDGLNRKVSNRLSRLRDVYAQENDSLDGLSDGSTSANGRKMIQQGCPGPGRLANDAVMHEGGFNGFTNAAEVPVSQLLQVWEEMREALFGAGGAAVQGLFSRDGGAAIQGSSNNETELRHSKKTMPNVKEQLSESKGDGMEGGGTIDMKKENKPVLHGDYIRNSTFHLAHVHGEDNYSMRKADISCSATLAPNKPIAEMSNYMKVVMEKPLPRNPWHEPEPGDDTPQGILLRKLQVNFGNPFRGTGTRKSKSGGRGSGINASDVGTTVDIIHEDVVASRPMLAEASLLQYTPPPSPIMDVGPAVEQQMNQESGSPLWKSPASGDLVIPLPDSRQPPSPSYDNNNVHVLPKLVHRKRKQGPSPFSPQEEKVKWWKAAPSTPKSPLPVSLFKVPTAQSEIDTSISMDSSEPFISFSGLLPPPKISSSMEPMKDSVLDPYSEEPTGSGQKLPSESTAMAECNTPPPIVTSQESAVVAAQLPSEGNSRKEDDYKRGVEGIQQMVVDAVDEGVLATNDTTCGMGSKAIGSDFEQQQHSPLLSPSKSQPVGVQSQPVPQFQPQDYELPEGWALVMSRREQRYYFFNKKSRESIWSPPPGSRLKQSPSQSVSKQVTTES